MVVCGVKPLSAQQPSRSVSPPPIAQRSATEDTSRGQAEREAALVEMLSGATLEGSFTSTGRGSDPTRLRSEKYTVGEVKKVGPGVWMISARIQYGEHDVTLPITVPVHWASDTPVIVVDNQALPGFGAVSARVMFFADHYAGYWKHGDHGGHLFVTISLVPVRPPDPPPLPAFGSEQTPDDSPKVSQSNSVKFRERR
jgi:hypothetical protein